MTVVWYTCQRCGFDWLPERGEKWNDLCPTCREEKRKPKRAPKNKMMEGTRENKHG